MILGGIEVNSLNIRSVIGDDPLLTLFWVNGWGNLNPNTPHPVTKLGPVTKLEKRNATSKKKSQSLFFQFIANLQPSGSRIPDAWSIKLTFSSIVTFHLTKTGNRAKKSLTQLLHYCFG